jgi:EAL domain-containing protein (putative c-di-GMP-specific phosphodiesterase class I)
MAQTPPFSCNGCKDGIEQPFPFSMAFQPIVDVDTGKAFAYEALVRGERGESAGSILGQVTKANRYAFDQRCRVKAISLAAQLGLSDTGAQLSINFMPGAVYSPAACIQLTLATAREVGFPCDQIIFEITEAEEVVDRAHIRAIVEFIGNAGSRSLWMMSVRATAALTCWPTSRPTSSNSIWI